MLSGDSIQSIATIIITVVILIASFRLGNFFNCCCSNLGCIMYHSPGLFSYTVEIVLCWNEPKLKYLILLILHGLNYWILFVIPLAENVEEELEMRQNEVYGMNLMPS